MFHTFSPSCFHRWMQIQSLSRIISVTLLFCRIIYRSARWFCKTWKWKFLGKGTEEIQADCPWGGYKGNSLYLTESLQVAPPFSPLPACICTGTIAQRSLCIVLLCFLGIRDKKCFLHFFSCLVSCFWETMIFRT